MVKGCFNDLNALLYKKTKEINLDRDIVLSKSENNYFSYTKGIKIKYDDVVINGKGHYIDARHSKRIFNITGKNVIIKNVTFKNGKAKFGGAIRNDKGQCEIINCKFDNNVAEERGNDISNGPESSMKLIDCVFLEKNAKSILNKGSMSISSSQKEELKPIISDGELTIINVPNNGHIFESRFDEAHFESEYAKAHFKSEYDEEILNEFYKNTIPIDVKSDENRYKKDSYIFVSYKHKDKKLVYPIIKELHEAGFNIWYDNGLYKGRNYDIEIADKITNCQLFITFITKEVINCSNNQEDYLIKELGVAKSKKKKRLPIFLENVELEGYYLMHYTDMQSILKYEFDDENKFINECIYTLINDFEIKPKNRLN